MGDGEELSREECIELEVTEPVERASAAAIWVKVQGRLVCIPQSTIHADSEVWKLGDTGRLVMAEWMAAKKGLA